jgi:hypothetical protein
MNETESPSRTVVSTNGEMPSAPGTAATPATMPDTITQAPPAPARRQRLRLMRLPGFAPTAPFGGLFAAWGAAAVATYAVLQAGVSLGVGFGLADGRGLANTNGFWSGLWMLLIQFGALLVGGYVAARMARNHAMAHAGLVWVLAMAATAADALVQRARTGGSSVLNQIGMPSWTETALQNNWRLWVVLGAFALAALIGVLVGGALGAVANRAAVVEIEPTRGGLPRSEVAPPA